MSPRAPLWDLLYVLHYYVFLVSLHTVVVPEEELLDDLLAMGYRRNAARRALIATENKSAWRCVANVVMFFFERMRDLAWLGVAWFC